jgi:hypothetical protein
MFEALTTMGFQVLMLLLGIPGQAIVFQDDP